MTELRRHFTPTAVTIETRAGDNAGTYLVGYAAMFDAWTTLYESDSWVWREVVRKGAFTAAVAERQDVRSLFNHDPNFVLGRTTAGTLSLRELDQGLHQETKLNDSPMIRDLVVGPIQRKDITGMSFGFTVRNKGGGQTTVEKNDGKVIIKRAGERITEYVKDNQLVTERELLSVDLFDVSPATYPAYDGTSVGVRAADFESLEQEARRLFDQHSQHRDQAWLDQAEGFLRLAEAGETHERNPMTSVEMRDKRAGLIKQARDLWSKANDQPDGPTAEQRQEFDRMIGAAQQLKDEYDRMERLEAAERDLDTPSQRLSTPFDSRPSREGTIATLTDYRASPAYAKIYRDWLIDGQTWDFRNRIPAEFRDTILGVAADTKGGYLTTPTQLASDIVKLVDDFVYIRQLATVITMGQAKAFGIPQVTSRMADANWTTEVQAVTEDTTMAFARRDLTPWPLTKLSKVSIRMLYADTNIETFLTTELGYKFALTEEKAFLSGSGVGQPLGIFTASANGIPAARDVNTGNTTTALVAQNIFEMKYSLKAPYRNDPTCRWLWSRQAVNQIMQLKDTQQRYLWEPSLQAGQPDRLLNISVLESEWVPNTFTTGLYVGAIGAFRYFWIAQVDELQIQRLVELYAGTNEVGFIGRRFLDASPALGEAFSRSKLA